MRILALDLGKSKSVGMHLCCMRDGFPLAPAGATACSQAVFPDDSPARSSTRPLERGTLCPWPWRPPRGRMRKHLRAQT